MAIEQTPPEDLPEDVQLWRNIRLPTLRQIITNPAYCPSNQIKRSTLILPDDSGHFHEYIEIGGQQYDIDNDLLYFEPPGRGSLRHNTGFFTPKAGKRDKKGGLVHIVTCDSEPAHYTRGTPAHCRRPSCPACSNYHIQTDTIEHVQKIESAVKFLRHTQGWKGGIRQHVEISPPPEQWLEFLTPDGNKRQRETARALLMEAGLLGGLIVAHPYRQNGINEADSLPAGYIPEASNDGDKHSARYGPHFHAVGMGYIDPMKVKQIYERTGWVIKSLRTGKDTIKNAAELTGVIKYIKSHVGVVSEASPYQPARYQTLVWFGVCSPRKQTRIGSIREYTPQICPECGEPLRLYDVHSCNNDISKGGLFSRPFDFGLYAPFEAREKARALAWFYAGDPVGLLGKLDRNPRLGVCVLSKRQLIRMSAPQSIKCLDGSLHCVQSDYTVRLRDRKNKKSLPALPDDLLPDAVEDLPGVTFAADPPEASPPASHGSDCFIDYHLPPGVPELDI